MRSTVAGHETTPNVSEFRAAVMARDLPGEFPGVLGFGLIVPVLRADLASFSANVRSEYNGNFSVVTVGNLPELFVVRSIEPLALNRAVLGFDVGSEITRRTAIESAVRSGALAITASVHLRQVTDGAWGAVYLLPVYTSDGAGNHNSIGLVFASVNYRTTLIDLDPKDAPLRFSLDDQGPDAETTVFAGQGAAFATVAARAHFRDSVLIHLGGRRFELSMVSTPSFDAAEGDRWPWGLGISAATITLLMAWAAWLSITGQRRALALARQMTHDLDRLSMVGKLTQDAVLVMDEKGRVKWANPAFYRASRRPPKEVLAHQATPFLGRLADDAPGQKKAWAAALAGEGAFHGLVSRPLPDGTMLWLETEIQSMRDAQNQPDGLVIIQSNVTSRRNAELQLRESQAFLDRTGRVAGVGGWQLELATRAITWSAHTRRIHEVPDSFTPSLTTALAFFSDDARENAESAVQRSIATGKGWDLELPLVTYRGRDIWVRVMGVVEFDGETPIRITGALQDITLRKRMELDLQQNRELLRVTLNSIGDGVITTDPAGVVTWMNPVAERLSGWSAAEATGRPITEVMLLISELTLHAVANPIMLALAEKKSVVMESNTLLLARDGTECAVDDSAAPIFDVRGNVLGGVMVFHDVTEMRAIHRTIAHHARHDLLTGLLNRLAFEDLASKGLEHAQSRSFNCVVLFIDLDHFKIINDTCGHAAGDELLRQVGGIIRSSVRSLDVVARLGGDEFVVFLENCPVDDGQIIAGKIRDAVDVYRFIAADHHQFQVGASIGIASSEAVGRSLETLLEAADNACYAAKTAGRNRVHVWTIQDGALKTSDKEFAWGVAIQRALDEHAFVVHAQQMVPLSERARSARGMHCEIALRMVSPEGELVLPVVFRRAAERHQLAAVVDRWLVQQVFHQLSQNAGRVGQGAHIGINLSRQSVSDPAFHEFLRGVMDQANFDVRVICFGITESAAIPNIAATAIFLAELKPRGVRTALVDFGASVPSPGYLEKLALDYLKLDDRFDRGISADPLKRVAVKNFCAVAEALGIRTVVGNAGDVHTPDILAALGVDYALGPDAGEPVLFSHWLTGLAVGDSNADDPGI